MDATRILAIRHGETAWNVDTRIQGHLDIPLNDTGRWQAERLARALAARDNIHAIYSSDLQRAHHTAQAIADATGAPLVTHPACANAASACFEGKTYAEIEQTWPEESERWRKREPHWAAARRRIAAAGARAHHAHPARAGRAPPGRTDRAWSRTAACMDQLYRAATGQDLQSPRTWQLRQHRRESPAVDAAGPLAGGLGGHHAPGRQHPR